MYEDTKMIYIFFNSFFFQCGSTFSNKTLMRPAPCSILPFLMGTFLTTTMEIDAQQIIVMQFILM